VVIDSIQKPGWLFGRESEWEAITEFVGAKGGVRLGLVYGRRRQGKTHLLQAVQQALHGFYWQAIQQSGRQNLDAFSQAWSSFAGLPAGLRFADWEQAVEAVVAHRADRSTVVVLDEIGYLIAAVPELPSLLQAALSPAKVAKGNARIILCGSALGQMRRLVDGKAPLRGRVSLELVVRPFGYVEAAGFWNLESNPDAAFRLHALVGGTPAYRDLAGSLPERGDIDKWVVRRLLDPRSALFREGRIVVSEDSMLVDQQLYWSVLGALAAGNERRTDIAHAIDRPETSMSHALSVLVEAGWVDLRPDPLHARRSRYRLADPIVRTWRLITENNLARLTLGGNAASSVWRDNEALVAARIYGPHLETLAAGWLLAGGRSCGLAESPTEVGASEVVIEGKKHQLDIVGLRRRGESSEVVAIGEVKATSQAVGPAELDRLDYIAASVAPDATRVLVARSGFTSPLRRRAEKRGDVVLADLHALYASS
jgi:uncharacterized protein